MPTPTWTRIQGVAHANTSLSTTGSVTISVTAGNFISVNIDCFGATGGHILTVADGGVNTYNQDIANENTYSVGEITNSIYSTIANTTASITIVVTSNKTSLITLDVQEFSFSSGTPSVNATAFGFDNIGSTSPSTGILSGLNESDLIIVGFDVNTPGLTYTIPSPFALSYSNNSASSEPFISQYDINETATSITPSCTLSLTSSWNSAAVAYSLASPPVNNVYDSDSSSSLQIQQDFRSPAQNESTISIESFIYSKSFILTDFSTPLTSLVILISSSGATDLGTVVESTYDQTNIPVTDSADLATAIDQQIVLNSYIDFDTSISLESYFLSYSPYQSDFAIADRDTQKVSVGTIITIVSYDNLATGFESQLTYNVLSTIDSDSASGSESQLPIFLTFYGTEIASASESSQPEILSGDSSLAIDKQIFASLMFSSSDQANSLETQLRMNIGGLVVTIFDTNITAGTEAWLRIVRAADSGVSQEKQEISTTFLTSGLTDTATGQESPLPIQLSADSPSAIELQLKSIFFVSADSAQASEAFTYYELIIQVDLARILERHFLSNSLITIGQGLIESSLGNETQLPIRLYSEFASESENQSKNIFSSSLSSISDFATGIETQLRIIIGIENPLARDIQFVFFSTMSTSSAGSESAFGQETPLRINLYYESQISIDLEIRTFLDSNPCFAIDQQTLFNFSILSSAATIDSAIASEAQLPVRLAGDFGSSFDGNEASTGQIIIPPPSTTSITDVLVGLFIYLNSTGVVGPNNVDFVIDPDSIILYPTNPGPIILIQPLSLTDASDTIGGGRFSKTWNWDIVIHVIVDNIYDQAFKDTIISESQSHFTGPFQIAYHVQKLVEQAYLVNSFFQPVTIEFPYFLNTDKIRRYKGANSYAGLPLRFSVVFRDNLPSLNIP